MNNNSFQKYTFVPILITAIFFFFVAFSFWREKQTPPVFIFIIMGVFLLLFALSTVPKKYAILSEKDTEVLKTSGTKVLTEFKTLDRRWSLQVNGQSPIIIFSQGKDPSTGAMRIFRSQDLWFSGGDTTQFENPTFKAWQKLQSIDPAKKYFIPVYIDQKISEKYFMDIGGLEIK